MNATAPTKVESIPFFEVLAFANRLFGGNPAGVCLLEEWLPNEKLKAIAAENNLPETEVAAIQPDFERIARLDAQGVVVTAPPGGES